MQLFCELKICQQRNLQILIVKIKFLRIIEFLKGLANTKANNLQFDQDS